MKIRPMPFILAALWALSGCAKAPSWEAAAKLQKDGQYAPAVKAYQDYLTAYPESNLKNRARLSLAQCEESLGNYAEAVRHYQEIASEHPGDYFEVQAYLGMGGLYHSRLNDEEKSLDAYEHALNLYLSQGDIRTAVRALVDAKMQTADAFFSRKDFQDASKLAQAILDSYPETYLPEGARGKAETMVDRVGRSTRLADADALQVYVLREEDGEGRDAEFPPVSAPATLLPSPDGSVQALVRRQENVPYLYLGSVRGTKVAFRLVPETSGVVAPSWSPKGDALLFVRKTRTLRRMVRLDAKKRSAYTLFSTQQATLGLVPQFDPSGTKIAYLYAGTVWVCNADGTNKTKLGISKPPSPEADLSWSSDGSQILVRQGPMKNRPGWSRILVLDAVPVRLAPSMAQPPAPKGSN